MSLNVAFNTATGGLNLIEKQISVTANNITNANQTGYTTETYTPTFESGGDAVIAVGGSIQGSIDQFLTKSVSEQNSDYSFKNIISSYLTNYDNSLGSTDSSTTTLSSALNSLQSDISSLTSSNDSSNQSAVVSAAQTVASQLNSLSSNLQSARMQANQQIAADVNTVNATLDNIASLNQQIAAAGPDENTANLEDQRVQDLQTLSQQMGIQYYFDSNNQLQVYTTSGSQLVHGTTDNHVTYTAAANVNSTTTYPGGFSGIMVQGQDITSDITTGEIGGLIQLRDTTLPAEQDKLDSLASSLMTTTNTVLNQGASIPSRNTLTSSANVNSTDGFSATGSVRIAITDGSGNVVSTNDIDLSAYGTVGDLVSALNGISGLSASIDSNGHLEISSTNPDDGVSINEMTSTVGGSNEGFSSYFGLNNLFDGTDASDITVSDYLSQNPQYLATGYLNDSPSLSAGQTGVASGDTSLATALYSAVTGQSSFVAAGNFAAQTTTLSNYANSILSDVATNTNSASEASDSSQTILTSLQNTVSSESGVNVDQETANATMLQNSYSATAQLMSAIETMFSSLMSAIGG